MTDGLDDNRVLVGQITGAHGIKGIVKIRSYTEKPQSIGIYGPLTDRQGRGVLVDIVGHTKDGLLAHIDGIDAREGAEQLRGTELYINRAALPALKEAAYEFYCADLLGLEVNSSLGQKLGEIVSVQNFGAGDILEIRLSERRTTILVPFTEAFVPNVALDDGYIIVNLLPGLVG